MWVQDGRVGSGRTETAGGWLAPGERAGKCGWIEEVGRGCLAGRILAELKVRMGLVLVMTGCGCLTRELLKMGVSGLSQSLPRKDGLVSAPRVSGAPPPEGPGPATPSGGRRLEGQPQSQS